jgi:hypothetical protein
MSDSTLHIAYALIRSGRKQLARGLLMPLLHDNPNHTDAWWLMAHAVEQEHHTRHALLQVLRLRPNDPRAAQKLAKLNLRAMHQQNFTLRGETPVEAIPVSVGVDDLFAGLAAEPQRVDLPADHPFYKERFHFDDAAQTQPARVLTEDELFNTPPPILTVDPFADLRGDEPFTGVAVGYDLAAGDPFPQVMDDNSDPFAGVPIKTHLDDHIYLARLSQTQTFNFPQITFAGDPFADVIPAPIPTRIRGAGARARAARANRQSADSSWWIMPSGLLLLGLITIVVWVWRGSERPLEVWCGAQRMIDNPASGQQLSNVSDLGELRYNTTIDTEFTAEQPRQAYWFEGQAGDLVQVDVSALEAGIDPRVQMFYSGRQFGYCDDNDKGAGDTSARLIVRLPYTGRYYILADHFGDPDGAYRLVIGRIGD